MSKSTLYIIQVQAPIEIEGRMVRKPLYPMFSAAGQLIRWSRDRKDTQRYTRESAINQASLLQGHLRRYDAKDKIEIVPSTGGAPIVANLEPCSYCHTTLCHGSRMACEQIQARQKRAEVSRG